MKKFWEALIVLVIIVGGYLLFFRPRHFSMNIPPAQNGSTSENASNVLASQSNVQSISKMSNSTSPTGIVSDQLASRAASPNAAPLPGGETNALPNLPPLTVLDKARVIIHNYRDALGEDPVGTNPEITAALKGKNPKQTDFLSDSGLRVNDKGELLDSYGTPFFFHQISGHEMEIRSAGEDRKMWTGDDLVTK